MRIRRIDDAIERCRKHLSAAGSVDKEVENLLVQVNHRHNIAHGEGSDATLEEVKQYYESGHEVLDYFKDALFWSEEEDAESDD